MKNMKKALLIVAGIAVLFAAIFISGCVSGQVTAAPENDGSATSTPTQEQTIIQVMGNPALDGYGVAETISDNPVNTKLATEKAVADALNKTLAVEKTFSGKINASNLELDFTKAGQFLKVGPDGELTYGKPVTYYSGGGGSTTNVYNTANWGSVGGNISNQTDLMTILDDKQKKLTAGANITIDANGTISATGGSGTSLLAGDGIDITGNTIKVRPASAFALGGVIIGSGLDVAADGTVRANISDVKIDGGSSLVSSGVATIPKATSSDFGVVKPDGTTITVTNGIISATGSAPAWGNITGTLSAQTDLQTALNAKINTSDIVDDLSSTDASKVLSAKQGKTLNDTIATKQDTLINGTNLKSVNGQSLLGSGDILISSTTSFATITGNPEDNTNLATSLNAKINTSDIVNDLTSGGSSKVLSAEQGKTLNTSLAGKVTAEAGKGLSTNDFTNDNKTKLDSLATIKSVGTGLSLDGTTGELTATSSAPTWGTITGTLSAQTDLQSELDAKINTSDIVNDLTSGGSSKVLSAEQGRTLNDTKQANLPTTTTSGQVLTSTSTAGTVQWSDPDYQTILNITHPVNSFYTQISADDNPNILFNEPGKYTSTWTDVSATYNGRYMRIDNTNAVGTQLAEQLPNIKGNIYKVAVNSLSSAGALYGSNGGGGNGVSSGSDGHMDVNFDASRSSSVYTNGGAVRPLTTTVKLWKRTA